MVLCVAQVVQSGCELRRETVSCKSEPVNVNVNANTCVALSICLGALLTPVVPGLYHLLSVTPGHHC